MKGMDKLLAQLNSLSDLGDRAGLVEKPAKVVEAEAKARAPRSGIVQSGEGLRESIHTAASDTVDGAIAIVYTNARHAAFVEFGTGPKGEASHAGISPNVTPSYTQSPWWVHESQVDKAVAEKYHWFALETKEGTFYQITGQPARPYMYPALKNNEDTVTEMLGEAIRERIKDSL